MIAMYIQFFNGDGGMEAEAMARRADGTLLPPGMWRVRPTVGEERIMCIEEMPYHWREQVNDAGKLGRQLDLDPPECFKTCGKCGYRHKDSEPCP